MQEWLNRTIEDFRALGKSLGVVQLISREPAEEEFWPLYWNGKHEEGAASPTSADDLMIVDELVARGLNDERAAAVVIAFAWIVTNPAPT